MPLTNFLKRVLILDSASCLFMGAILLAGGGDLSDLLGLSGSLVSGAGSLLIPLGLFILWLGTRSAAHPALVWLVIVGNVGWAAESLIVAFTTAGITGLGTLFVAGQGAAVAALAALEYAGLQRSRAVAASWEGRRIRSAPRSALSLGSADPPAARRFGLAQARRAIPAATRADPATRRNSRPGISFSARTRAPIAAIQSRFMTPATNRSTISAQQQPRQ